MRRIKLLHKREAFYLAGALRDGSLSVQNQIKVTQKNKEWLTKTIIPIFNELFDLKLTERQIYKQEDKSGKRYYLLFKNKFVWYCLHTYFQMPRNQFYWNTPEFVRNAQDKLIFYYIQGFCDAEGGLPRRLTTGSKKYIHISQKNVDSLEFIRLVLNRNSIKTGNVNCSDKKSNTHRLSITKKESMLSFIKKVKTLHPDKKIIFDAMKQIFS